MANITELSDRILAAERELSDAVEKALIVVGTPAWIAAKAYLTELRRKENNLLEKQGESQLLTLLTKSKFASPCMAK